MTPEPDEGEPPALRVGFYTGRQVVAVGDTLLADHGLGRVVNELHRLFPDLLLAAVDYGTTTKIHTEPLSLDERAWLRLPVMPSFGRGLSRTLSCRRVLRELEARCDVVLVQLTFQAPLALLRPRTPRVYHLFSDVLGMARSPRYRGFRRAVAVTYATVVDAIQARLFAAPRTRLVTNGRALLEHYGGRGRAAVSATISEADIRCVQRRRRGGRSRILFVAHLRHEKGVDVLLDAFVRLRQDVDAELEIIGSGDPSDLGPEVAADIAREVEAGHVRVLGEVPFGPDLFQHFADADVFVLPSRSEGTPRVLVEARAFGCPVVATAVGGIPTSVTDEVDGLLVPPEDAARLAAALRRVLEDGELRRSLVAEGRRHAGGTTVESFAAILAEELIAVAGGERTTRASPGDGTATHASER